jgi:hypothetical protein
MPRIMSQQSGQTEPYFIHNAGVVGNVTNGARVKVEQSAGKAIDIAALSQLLTQIREALPLLPPEAQKKLEIVVDQIDMETTRPKPDAGRIETLLSSARSIAEGVTGNVVASGITSVISQIFCV